MSTYICKCGRRVKKSTNADNTGNRLEGYGPGHECYGCPYVLSWGNYEWNEEAKSLEQKAKGYECRMSKTLSYASQFIGSTKDKCTCSVVSLDFGFLEQISAWVKETFTLGELTGHFSRDKIRATEYCHNGRYQYALYCAQNKKGIAAKAALFEHFFNSDGSRNDMTPQQEMEKVLTDIRKAKEATECATAQNAGAAATTAENAVLNAATATSTTSENGADASALNQEASPQGCESGPAVLAESFSAGEAVGGTSSPNLTLPANTKTPTAFDYAGLDTQTVDVLHMAESQYSKGKKMAETGLRWMVNAVSMAHDALCGGVVQQLDNSKHGNRGDDSFRAWCESISLSKSSAYNLLRVAERFGNIEVDGKSILDVQPATLLYEAAKPSAPADMVQKVTTCEITSSAEYRAVLKENQQLRTDRVEAMNQADRERARADLAESERDKARADQLSTAKDCNRLGLKVSQEKDRADRAEARAKDAEDALKHQPITAVVDEEEVDRRASEKAWGLADARNRELQEENDRLKKNSAQLERRMKAVTSRMDDLGQTDFETANHCPEAMLAIWNSCKGSYSRLTGEDLENTFQYICNTLNSIRQEAALLCRQPEGYDGGAA
nr:MAG TPA: Protein of unknown function (DUF3102) [Caudoviricetes sp.]